MNELKDVKKHIRSVLKGGDILFIVPPFVTSRTPILGPHILQSIALEHGYKANILYVNLLLASIIGTELYESISYGQPYRMLGERLFARSAYGLPPLGKSPELCLNPAQSVFDNGWPYSIEEFEYKYYKTADFDLDTFLKIEETCFSLVKGVYQTTASLGYKIVGCSTNWEQNNCCIALIDGIKKIQPNVITLIGGSNCEAEMAEGIASLSDSIDYIFSGESESTFADFLKQYAAGNLPSQRVVEGEPVEDLDNIPLPDYDSYFKQIDCFFNDNPPKEIVVSCETSRGCWYGKCFFCGMNGKRMRFRKKEVKKVVKELEQIYIRYPEHRVFLIDKLFPNSFENELLPLLIDNEDTPPITSEHRPGLKLHELISLKKAKINILKFGIEALSTGLLKLMNKGVKSRQNILLLRNTGSVGLFVDWNLLWGFPGDKASFYKETLEIIPLIHHLSPPSVFRHLSLDRFCAYFEKPAEYQIENLRPWAVYNMVYPHWADMQKLSYRFTGDYPCEAHGHPELIKEIAKEIESWRKSWGKSNLKMFSYADYFNIHDSRSVTGKDKNHTLESTRAKEILTHGIYNATENQKWAVEEKFGVILDSWYVPLITASPELLLKFEEKH